VFAIAAYLAVRIGSAAARRFEREMSTGTGLDVIERTKRARTVSGVVQKTLSAAVISIAGLMILRELDIDIRPVLTGAGIVGLAVGFGAQTLVRDIISGFFLILEDQARVGDVAVVNGQGGLIEAVNLRTIVLRDEEGTVHVFPNGEVKTLANKSKDFSYFVFSVKLPLEADPDEVGTALRDAAATLIEDEQFKPHNLAPFELYGMDKLEPGQFTLKGRIKPHYQASQSAAPGEPVAPPVEFTFQYSAANRVLEIKFTKPLERFRTLKVDLVEGIVGTDGQSLKPWTLTFMLGGS